MTFVIAPLEPLKHVLIQSAPSLPPECWWMAACVIIILALAATIDAFTTLVPDGLILLGMISLAVVQGLSTSWGLAFLHLGCGIMAALFIWAINFAWYTQMGYDALGMGDAKWTALAVACFGLKPAFFAWGIAAMLGVFFIGVARLAGERVTQLSFAPFLLSGLGLGIYWLRFVQ